MSSLDRIRLIDPLSIDMTRHRWWWVAVCLYVGAVFLLPTFAAHSVPQTGASFDKLYHGAEYLGLAVIVGMALNERWLLTILLCVAVAGADEAHQLLLPLRHADVLDFAADVGGLLLGVGASYGFLLWYRTRRILAKRRPGKDK